MKKINSILQHMLINKKVQFLTFVFFYLFCHQLLGNVLQDTTKISTLNIEALKIVRSDPDRSISLAHETLRLSKLHGYQKGIADANQALGKAYLAKYNPQDSATYYLHHALDLYTFLKNYNGIAHTCFGLSYLYNFKGNSEKAIEFANMSLEFFEKKGSKREIIAALDGVIFLEIQNDNFKKALEFSDKAIEISRSINDTLQWANAINNKGNVLKDMLLLNQAIDAYFDAYQLWEIKKDTAGLAIAYGSIANVYSLEGDYEKSLNYNLKKLNIVKRGDNEWETNKTIDNIALSYSHLNKQDSAVYYMKKSLLIAENFNYPEGLSNTYNHMASVFLNLGNVDSTLYYSSKAIDIAEKINSPNLSKYQLNKSKALLKQNQLNEALILSKKAYSKAKQQNDFYTLRAISQILNDIYYKMGQHKLAYPYLNEFLKLNDSIKDIEYMQKVTHLDVQHVYETKQQKAQYEIKILEKNNQLKSARLQKTAIFSIVIILLSIAGASISFLIIKNKDHRIEQMNLKIRNYLFQLEKLKTDSNNENPLIELAKNFSLTQRETQIMELIATGIGNEEIAQKLFVSKNTIKFHIKNIFIKLDVQNRIQALQKMTV